MERLSGLQTDDFNYPEWQTPLLDALVELDKEKLKAKVAAAETALFNRQQALASDADHRAERQAIEDAFATLRVLKRDQLGFPDWHKK
jgi:hypothetical protein